MYNHIHLYMEISYVRDTIAYLRESRSQSIKITGKINNPQGKKINLDSLFHTQKSIPNRLRT